MDLPPNIPTSFVPHSASSVPRRFHVDFIGAFGFVAYAILALAIALAIAVFFYDRILAATKSSKDAELATAEAAIDTTTAQNFIRLHDRLTSGKALLNNHIAFSNVFATIEKILPSTVRFTSMQVSFGDTPMVKLNGAGVAKSFNALAAASASFAADGRIKDAIFSHLSVNKDNSVSFSLTATLDQKLVSFSAPAVASTTVPATTASTTGSTGSPQAASTTPTL